MHSAPCPSWPKKGRPTRATRGGEELNEHKPEDTTASQDQGTADVKRRDRSLSFCETVGSPLGLPKLEVVKPAASLEDVPASSLSSLVRWTFFAHDLQMFPSYTANLTQFKAGSRTASDTLLAEVVEDEDEGEDSGLEEATVLLLTVARL